MSNYKQAENERSDIDSSGVSYRDLFQYNPQPMWVYDVETFAILDVNEAAVRHYGYSKAEFLQLTIKDIRPCYDIPVVEAAVEAVRQHDKLYTTGIYRHKKKDGSIIYVTLQSNIIYINGRKAELVLSTDITEKRKTDEKFRAIFEHTRDAIIISNDDGHCLDFNDATVALFGYTKEELSRMSLFDFIVLREGQDSNDVWRRFLNGEILEGTTQVRHKAGNIIIASFNAQPDILPGMHLCILADVTESVLKSSDLTLSNERYKLILNAANEAIYDWDILQNKVEWGTGFKDIFGYDLQVHANRIWSENIYEEDKLRVLDEIITAKADPGCAMTVTECRYIKFDGSVALVEHRIIFLRNESGVAIRAVGSVRDITDYKQNLHRIQLQNEQLKDIAWIQSHVVRAPLARLMGLVELLKMGEYGELGKDVVLNLVHDSAAELDKVIKDIVSKADKVQIRHED
ncbi:PAS domain S-box protein [Dyadobacter sp. CY326]|uniref:PAS domain-containing protein n=1 Tax=Dyadobacter sp. CY326 TaxID=2907300 RepID=UPI001F432732|nr:PAS domain S-box protein [Dyadobacter sp. CY326]MCE7064210.1 PAS domain S-box protein [Dyadobacter sp. CY326]